MQRTSEGTRLLTASLLVGFILNYIREVTQLPAYHNGDGCPFSANRRSNLKHCFIPALGDATTVGMTYLIGWALKAIPNWIRRLGWRDIGLVSLPLTLVPINVERVSLHRLRWWQYNQHMPIIPLINGGLLPIVQLPLLTLITFGLAPRLVRKENQD